MLSQHPLYKETLRKIHIYLINKKSDPHNNWVNSYREQVLHRVRAIGPEYLDVNNYITPDDISGMERLYLDLTIYLNLDFWE